MKEWSLFHPQSITGSREHHRLPSQDLGRSPAVNDFWTCYTQLYVFQSLVVALVLSRLDYCNGVLTGLPANLIRRLQSVQNAAARLIFGIRRSEHITDALASLHWLRVPESQSLP